MIYFVGTSFAPIHLRIAATLRGLKIAEKIGDADLVFISEDTPVKASGERDLQPIRQLIIQTVLCDAHPEATIVLTSQVPPGFTRATGGGRLYHMSETLRVKDAAERALHPEQFIVGCLNPEKPLPLVFLNYLIAFNCPVFQVSYEEAEFAKIAINMTLAAQVDNANHLSAVAARVGANWEKVANILRHDRRIGHYSYLEPGDWKQSPHLLRDYMTIKNL